MILSMILSYHWRTTLWMNLDNFCLDFDNNSETRFSDMGAGHNSENDLGQVEGGILSKYTDAQLC